MKWHLTSSVFTLIPSILLAGPYPPAVGVIGSDAVSAMDSRFVAWASSAVIERGPENLLDFEGPLVAYGIEIDALGPADATSLEPFPVVSLGDGGHATVEFSEPFRDVAGPDFAVFENAFAVTFLELAHVAVSSDGIHFFPFPSVSLTSTGSMPEATNLRNLAGKYIAGYGTPFDLAELKNVSELLDIQRITHIRVTDAVGSASPAIGRQDSLGHWIVDPHPTPFFSGGFDLDAVGYFAATIQNYEQWLAAGNADNVLEYVSDSRRFRILQSGGSVRLDFIYYAYRRNAKLVLESSTDLRAWQPVAESTALGTITAVNPSASISVVGEQRQQVRIELPRLGQQFFRLAAQRQPAP
ncbi:MAG: hypothetical protein EAZ42_11130 [Verrucomicrobia bacterium]|nr:MAG: hypothetical protein EAZ42_11130 [Verrucomicrobiota bacterium]